MTGPADEPEYETPPIAYIGYTGSERGPGWLERFWAWLSGDRPG